MHWQLPPSAVLLRSVQKVYDRACRKDSEIQEVLQPLFQPPPSFSGNIGRDTYIFKCGEFRKKLVELEDKADIVISESSKLSSP